MGVYENVMKIIAERNLTKKRVEVLAGVANGTIAGWGNGSKPLLETVMKIAQALDVKIDELIER